MVVTTLGEKNTMSAQQIIVLITVPSKDVGLKIARILVENGLAACVNLLPGIRSVYRWEGSIAEDEELLLIVKTKQSLFETLSDTVTQNHPYDVPEVIALPIVTGLKEYLSWMDEETI